MVTWKSNLPQVQPLIDRKIRDVHADTVDLALESIVNGSSLTGAPGQPEDLRQGQWAVTSESLDSKISTTDSSAQAVEDGISHFNGHPITLDHPGGGFHSVALSRLGFDKLATAAVNRVGRVS